jgi:hypothetical protein
MNAFVDAVKNQPARTANGMRARKNTANALVDLFFKVGSMRGKDVTPLMAAAMAENRELALRIAAWVRDARGGAGERETFRNILRYLEKHDREAASALMYLVPELGRWDDLFVFSDTDLKAQAYTMVGDALRARNGLAAKWTPRKGPVALELRKFYGMTPKQYRKSLVALTNVVETNMCANDWDNINFSHVPGVAAARYKKAFNRHTPKYAAYVAALVKGEDPRVKVNAGAVFPHDVLKGKIRASGVNYNQTELDLMTKQWDALPNYVGDASILPLVDVSGSMETQVPGNVRLSCLDVAVSLGLYLSDKNQGAFHGTFMTFSGHPELMSLNGNIVQKINQMVRSNWDMNTNLHAAFTKILKTAVDSKVPAADMPRFLLILSDMQFDQCVTHDDSALQMIARKYEAAGYEVPQVVFWNLNAADNVPVKFNQKGAALVSGFSPAIMKAILASDTSQFTPEGIMMKTIMQDRYQVL